MSNTNIDRATFTVSFQRTLRASPEDVFDAWTHPAEVAEWWDPTGAKLVECTIDLRPGGSFTFVNEGHSPPFSGVYRTVERPSRLVFEALGAVGTVLIESAGDTTHMHVSIRCASAEHLEKFVELGVDVNTAKTLDNLVAHVKKRAA